MSRSVITLLERFEKVKRKLNPKLKKDLLSITKGTSDLTLEDEIGYLVQGNPTTLPNYLKEITQDTYAGTSTYEQLLELAESDEYYFFEKGKRAIFTYNTKEIVIKTKAKTSIERAKRFNQEINKIIK